MAKYLGETPVDISQSQFKDYTASDWAMYFIECYGQIDGGHHKQWVIDQVARILKGTKVVVTLAKWNDGEENIRVNLEEPSKDYIDWVKEYVNDGEYSYDGGIAP